MMKKTFIYFKSYIVKNEYTYSSYSTTEYYSRKITFPCLVLYLVNLLIQNRDNGSQFCRFRNHKGKCCEDILLSLF